MTLASSRQADLVFGTEADQGPPDVSGFLGPWHNTNARTSRIRRLTVEAMDAGLSVRIWGVAGGGLFDWGPQPAEAFTCIEENGVQATSLYANYDFGFMTTALQWRLNKGILPLMSFNVFRDDSGRSNYYTRELFCRSDMSGDAA